MRQQEFTDTVRWELGETALAPPEPGDAARMARRVLGTRTRRRQRTLAGAAAAAVVLALGAATIVTTQTTSSQVQAVPVTQWPARGSLAGNVDLIERARWDWGGQAAQVVFAGSRPEVGTIVVLRSQEHDGGVRLAFLTGPELAVQAQLTVPAGRLTAPAYGFVASAPNGGPATGVAVTAPQVDTAAFTSGETQVADGLATAELPPTAAAWNTSLATGNPQHPVFGELSTSAHDPAISTGTVVRARDDAQFGISGVDAKPGDVVATRAGFVGVITEGRDDFAAVKSNPGALSEPWGLRATTATGEPVTLTDTGSSVDSPVIVTPAGAGELHDGDRIVLTGFGHSAAVVALGTVHAGRLQRAVRVPPDGTEVLLIHR
ncbi:hypothetical protein [Amycolatopsis sp. DSM 110486]|uniref:hypothetical protein n=1 Tax=Amycolatopsis sp. DSM 110486 TaxID=2865832 RepID=UPI001C6A21DD|nr:hypothetical protein [Amycolatopsis sp. DSM 110486]QYN24273.1 hypothetical protein K1T34_18605 [Amycolatopsis sp. DSM 110486]